MQRMFALVIYLPCLVACKQRKPKPVVSSVNDTAIAKKNDSIISYINYHYFLKYSESDQKYLASFDKWCSTEKGKQEYRSLLAYIKKKYNFKSVGYGARLTPPHLFFFLYEPDNITYKCTRKEYLQLHPRHDAIRKEMINELYNLSPSIDEVTCVFSDQSGNEYVVATTMDTLYRDYIPDPNVQKKVVQVKRNLQTICNWLTRLYGTYDKVRAEPNIFKEGNRTYTNVEFKIPLDATQETLASDSMYKIFISDLIKKVSPDFQRICLEYGYHFPAYHNDTLLNNPSLNL